MTPLHGMECFCFQDMQAILPGALTWIHDKYYFNKALTLKESFIKVSNSSGHTGGLK